MSQGCLSIRKSDTLNHSGIRASSIRAEGADNWLEQGERALAAGDVRNALAAFEKALEANPAALHARLRRALALAMLGMKRAALLDARTVFHAAIEQEPGLLGTVLSYAGDPGKALPAYRAALVQAPGDAGLLYNLATTLRMTGAFPEAEGICDELIRRDPLNVPALALRSELRTQSPARNHVEQLREALSRHLSPAHRVQLHFALGKEYEDLALHEEAFASFATGCSLKRSQMRYNVDNDLVTLEAIRTTHTAKRLANSTAGYSDAAPIFVLGLPRTGTTIVERVLSMHDDTYSVGESNAFTLELLRLTGQWTGSKVGLVEASLDVNPRELGSNYVHAIGSLEGDPQGRVIDKMPLHYLYAGLIARSLPRGCFILLERGAMDSIYAMYKSLFVGAYPFSYELTELARYFVEWRKLVEHWKSVLGERLFIMKYENLVAKPEQEITALLAHCGIPWSDQCLQFFANQSPTATLSAVQVRQPLHERSVGRWRTHAHSLEPAAAILRAEGVPLE